MALREQLEYGFTAGLLHFSRILPEAAVYALFRGFARLFYALSGRRRRIALRNTEIVFPDRPLNERRRLVRTSYLNLAEAMALNLLIMTNRISNDRLMQMVVTDDWDRLEQTLADHNKGFLAVTGHLGNWELMPQYAALRLGRQVHVIARQGNNRLLEDRVVRPLRERFGVSVFYKKNALIRIMKAINKGDACGLLIDQKLNPPEGIFVNFFGKKAPTTGSSAVLQIRFGITVLPVFMVREQRGRFRLLIGAPFEWNDNGKPMEEQVYALTEKHQQAVEQMILRYPDQWFWAHNRWGLPKEQR